MKETKFLSQDLYNIKLSAADKEQLRKLIIDFIAAAYAGFRQNTSFNERVKKVVFPNLHDEESYILFHSDKYPVRLAAFMNSLYGHGAELDDGNKKAAGHVGVHIIPAVFSLADKLKSSNDDVLLALATGYEAYIRISSAAQPGMVNRGFHSTGMAGTLACAAASARLYHLNSQGIEDAIALSTTLSGGLLSYGDSRPAIKPLNPGKAAENGVFAAMLAYAGVKGPTESLEGRNGWFHAVSEDIHSEYLLSSDHLLIHDCYFKLYPSCRHTHCCIDAGIYFHDIVDINSIDRINIYIYPNAIKLAGIRIPNNQDETKFSIYYTFACALINGSYSINDMDIKNVNKTILNIIDKINLISDFSMENREKGIRGAKVEIKMIDNSLYEKTILVPKGDPENPLSKTDIINKLRVCINGQISEQRMQDIINCIDLIEGTSTFSNPFQLTGVEHE